MDLDFSKNIILENEVILLRPLVLTDTHLLEEAAFSDPLLLQYSPKTVETPEKLQAYVAAAEHLRERDERYSFIIFDKRIEKWIGSTSFYAVSNFDKRLAIGATWFAKWAQRTGANRHTKFIMMQYAFETLEFERVELHTDIRNAASRRAIQAIGGIEEGIMRSFTVMPDGYRRSTITYSILRDEWRGLRQTVFQNF